MAWILSDKPAPFPWVIEDTVRDSEVATGLVNSGWTHDEEARIARLIAAAPDLLAALGAVLPLAQSWADGVGRSHPDHEVVADALAAIAKATGE